MYKQAIAHRQASIQVIKETPPSEWSAEYAQQCIDAAQAQIDQFQELQLINECSDLFPKDSIEAIKSWINSAEEYDQPLTVAEYSFYRQLSNFAVKPQQSLTLTDEQYTQLGLSIAKAFGLKADKKNQQYPVYGGKTAIGLGRMMVREVNEVLNPKVEDDDITDQSGC